MKTAMDIQMAAQKTTGRTKTTSTEAAIMTVQFNIQNVIKNKTKILAGLFVVGMMAVTLMLPGNASADNPARPAGRSGRVLDIDTDI